MPCTENYSTCFVLLLLYLFFTICPEIGIAWRSGYSDGLDSGVSPPHSSSRGSRWSGNMPFWHLHPPYQDLDCTHVFTLFRYVRRKKNPALSKNRTHDFRTNIVGSRGYPLDPSGDRGKYPIDNFPGKQECKVETRLKWLGSRIKSYKYFMAFMRVQLSPSAFSTCFKVIRLIDRKPY